MKEAPPKPPKIQPFGEMALVEQIKPAKQTEGGIVLPDVAQKEEKVLRGKVLAVGPGKWIEGGFRPADCKPGQIVLYPRNVAFPLDKDADFVLIDSWKLLGAEA